MGVHFVYAGGTTAHATALFFVELEVKISIIGILITKKFLADGSS